MIDGCSLEVEGNIQSNVPQKGVSGYVRLERGSSIAPRSLPPPLPGMYGMSGAKKVQLRRSFTK